MHTEHLQNVKLSRVLSGWLVACAVSALSIFAITAMGWFDPDTGAGALWSGTAVLIGFWAGGYATGFRAMQAPVLHGVAIGLCTLLIWFALNLIATLFFPSAGWEALTPALAVGILLVQIAAAVVGALMGYNMALKGRPTLEEHAPMVE